MPQNICFLDPRHWCRRLVVVVAVAPPKVVEFILQLHMSTALFSAATLLCVAASSVRSSLIVVTCAT